MATSSQGADTEVAVIGAGPYGLSIASHLAGAGVDHQIFGSPMSYWRERMPAGMMLRSSWDASHISSPDSELSLDRYQTTVKAPVGRPIPLSTFVEYGEWFQGRAAPELQQTMVECVEPEGTTFRLTLRDGDRRRAQRVVVATGLDSFPSIPPVFSGLPPSRCLHAASITDPGAFAGKRVAVIGGGQSALETAALVKEAGAHVEVLVRDGHVHWLKRSMKLHQKDGFARRLLYPPTDVGPPVLNQIVARPHLWKALPPSLRGRVAYRSIRPAGAGWLVSRLRDVSISLGCAVESVAERDEHVVLHLRNGSGREVDSVILGTGYAVDARRYTFLSQDILRRVRLNSGYPSLGRGFESSVSGLHFVGAASALSFGPVMRFVSGTAFTSRELTGHVRGRRS